MAIVSSIQTINQAGILWKRRRKVKVKESEVAQSCLTLCDPMDCSLTKFLCTWAFPGKNTGVGCHFLVQGTFPTQESNLSLLHCRQTLYLRSHQGSPCHVKPTLNKHAYVSPVHLCQSSSQTQLGTLRGLTCTNSMT